MDVFAMSIEYVIVVSAFNQRYQIIESISNLHILNTVCITSRQSHALLLGHIPDVLYDSAVKKQKEEND